MEKAEKFYNTIIEKVKECGEIISGTKEAYEIIKEILK